MIDGFPGFSKLDHVGILTHDLLTVETFFGSLGFAVGEREDDDELRLAFLWVTAGDVPLEFIMPLDDSVSAARRLRERGPGLDHVALRVDSVAVALEWCRAHDVPLLDAVPRRGARGARIAFIAPEAAAGARVELVERAPADRPASRP